MAQLPAPRRPGAWTDSSPSSCLQAGLEHPQRLGAHSWQRESCLPVPSPDLCLWPLPSGSCGAGGSWVTLVSVVGPLLENDPLHHDTPLSVPSGERPHLHRLCSSCAQTLQLLLFVRRISRSVCRWEEGRRVPHVQELVRLPRLSLSVFTCTGPFRPGEDVCAQGRVPDFSPQRLTVEKSCFPGNVPGRQHCGLAAGVPTGFSDVLCERVPRPEAPGHFASPPPTAGASCPRPLLRWAVFSNLSLLSSSSPRPSCRLSVGVPHAASEEGAPPSCSPLALQPPTPHPGKWASNIHPLSLEIRREKHLQPGEAESHN
ncbi:uncharacterized protein [Physeter macrocephalus]|uniref:Uncharacterized protein n=1 Tax=Physeter macrocephalus TaxID=9755 RepID=A0A9W2WD21_PHYMC|nr:uncharacterized protein LOC129391643 [Physeter catodon]